MKLKYTFILAWFCAAGIFAQEEKSSQSEKQKKDDEKVHWRERQFSDGQRVRESGTHAGIMSKDEPTNYEHGTREVQETLNRLNCEKGVRLGPWVESEFLKSYSQNYPLSKVSSEKLDEIFENYVKTRTNIGGDKVYCTVVIKNHSDKPEADVYLNDIYFCKLFEAKAGIVLHCNENYVIELKLNNVSICLANFISTRGGTEFLQCDKPLAKARKQESLPQQSLRQPSDAGTRTRITPKKIK